MKFYGTKGSIVIISYIKIIESMLIGAHINIPNMYTFKKGMKFEKIYMLGTYEHMVQFWPFTSPKLKFDYDFGRKTFT